MPTQHFYTVDFRYSSDFIIDNIMLYSVQTGVITSYVFSHFFPKALLSLHDTLTVLYHRITVVVTFICVSIHNSLNLICMSHRSLQWVAMPQNLIFLALYFVIAKSALLFESRTRPIALIVLCAFSVCKLIAGNVSCLCILHSSSAPDSVQTFSLNARKSLKDRSGDGSDPWRDNTIRLPPLFRGRVLRRSHHRVRIHPPTT